MQRLDMEKVAQESEISTRVTKKNSDIFGDFLLCSLMIQ